MKTQITSRLAMIFALSSALFAQTGMAQISLNETQLDTPPALLESKLETFNIDPKLHYADEVKSGTVQVDFAQSKLILTLDLPFYCPPGLYCIQVMPAPITVELPIVDIQTECGSKIYVAKRDMRVVDGNFESLTVADHKTRICEDFRPAVEVTHTIKTSGMIEERTYESHYTGSEFVFKNIILN